MKSSKIISSTEIIKFSSFGVARRAYYREATSDLFVIYENDYDRASYSIDDVWIDAGGYIGDFAMKYSHLVKQIISFEPDVDAFTIACANTRLNAISNVINIPTALSDAYEPMKLYTNAGENKAKNSTISVDGWAAVEVPTTNIFDAIAGYTPNALKLDIEGYEIPLLASLIAADALVCFKKIIIEVHLSEKQVPESHRSRWLALFQYLISQYHGTKIGEDAAYETETWFFESKH
jgi:FkbM family methyltransferase